VALILAAVLEQFKYKEAAVLFASLAIVVFVFTPNHPRKN
jgi:hypothetical protein